MKLKHIISCGIFLLIFFVSCIKTFGQNKPNADFEMLNSSKNWVLGFSDSGKQNWQSQWFLDGKLASVKNTKRGMLFSAGPVNGDDAHHAVLWTKDSFKGDVKIQFEYTRTDTQSKNVCILYVQATGKGEAPYSRDISEWNALREIPSMRTYFNNMNALHISFAAFTNRGDKYDYIRARRYPTSDEISFKETEVPPSYNNVGFFETGVPYKITFIKSDLKVYFYVEGKTDSRLFSWTMTPNQRLTDGRIGLRHMYTRSARYKNFKVFVQEYVDKPL